MEQGILKIALNYIERGWFVIPLNLGEKWIDSTLGNRLNWDGITQTEEEIRRWLEIEPNLNIGIRMKESGLTVLDIDHPEHLKKKTDEFERCPTVMTPKGWHHYYTASPDDVSGQLWTEEGLFLGDFLAPSQPPWREYHQAYVVAPPSVVNNHLYQWIEPPVSSLISSRPTPPAVPLGPVPDWIRGLIRIPDEPPRSWVDGPDEGEYGYDDKWDEDDDYLFYGPDVDPDEEFEEGEEVDDERSD